MKKINQMTLSVVSALAIASLFAACGQPKDKSPFYGRALDAAKQAAAATPAAKAQDTSTLTSQDTNLTVNLGKSAVTADGKVPVEISGSLKVTGSPDPLAFKFDFNAVDSVNFTQQAQNLFIFKNGIYLIVDGSCANGCSTIFSKVSVLAMDQNNQVTASKSFALKRVSGDATQNKIVDLSADQQNFSIDEVIASFNPAVAAPVSTAPAAQPTAADPAAVTPVAPTTSQPAPQPVDPSTNSQPQPQQSPITQPAAAL